MFMAIHKTCPFRDPSTLLSLQFESEGQRDEAEVNPSHPEAGRCANIGPTEKTGWIWMDRFIMFPW